MTQISTTPIIKAIHFAAHKHRQQRRKDPDQTPYINHPIELLKLLANDVGIVDPVVLVGAILHDTVEDTATTLTEIDAIFGSEVATVVSQLTDDKSLPQATRKQLQIDHAAQLSDRAKLVKLADKIANVRDIASAPPPDWPLARCLAYCDWGKRVVDQLRGIYPYLESLFDQAYGQAYNQLTNRPADESVKGSPSGR
ncbi:MAG: HD domain-containing protein [Leptolyngbyaceae cyanobacterium]